MEFMVTSVIATWRELYKPWIWRFTDRELAEIILAIRYRDDFNHGTEGHNARITIAKLFDTIQALEATHERTRDGGNANAQTQL